MQKNDFGGNWHSLLEKIIYKLKALTYIDRECKKLYHSYYQYSSVFTLNSCSRGIRWWAKRCRDARYWCVIL